MFDTSAGRVPREPVRASCYGWGVLGNQQAAEQDATHATSCLPVPRWSHPFRRARTDASCGASLPRLLLREVGRGRESQRTLLG
jgi:hypothetical protein